MAIQVSGLEAETLDTCQEKSEACAKLVIIWLVFNWPWSDGLYSAAYDLGYLDPPHISIRLSVCTEARAVTGTR